MYSIYNSIFNSMTLLKNIYILMFISSCCVAGYGQMYIKIHVKPNTFSSLFDTLHIPSNNNNWDPGAFSQFNGTNIYEIPKFSGTMEYKVTRGTWNAVEGNATGKDISNRTLTYKEADTVLIEVETWKDIYSSSSHTAKKEVKILKSDFPLTPFNKKRRIWIYLPERYGADDDKFPVLYMHDGQNLFDRALSFAGEWQVDEAMSVISKDNLDCIVVGIDNGGTDRIDEYTPYKNPKYNGGKGEDYTEFLVKTLKPFIDQHFRTLPEPEHTGIAGSSLGGLISFYSAIKYPNIFGKVGVFSPSFWYSDSLIADVKAYVANPNQKFYFVAGQNEDEDMVPDIEKYINLLNNAGVTNSQIYKLIKQDGQHSEWFWAREFPAAFNWLDLWGITSKSNKINTPINYFSVLQSPSQIPIIVINSNLPGKSTLIISNLSTGKMISQQNVMPGDTIQFERINRAGAYSATLQYQDLKQTIKFVKLN